MLRCYGTNELCKCRLLVIRHSSANHFPFNFTYVSAFNDISNHLTYNGWIFKPHQEHLNGLRTVTT